MLKSSPWSFPVVVVDKKDGNKRFYMVFRLMDKITKSNSWRLLLFDVSLDHLGKASYFNSFKFEVGMVVINDRGREKTTLICHQGLFEVNLMPFDLSNAPLVLCERMSVVWQGQDYFAFVYLDDSLIFTRIIGGKYPVCI